MNTKINNILVPVDFTEYSIKALETAVHIAKRNYARVVALHVLDLSSSIITSMDNLIEEHLFLDTLDEKRNYLLDKLKNTIKKKYQFDIEVLLRKGLIVSSILKNAEKINADMIIMGTHGTGPKTIFLGSHAYFIVKRAVCPVLAIPGVKRPGGFTKYLFPYWAMNEALEKYEFLKRIVQKKDIVAEITGLIKNEGITNINVLNETVNYLDNKLAARMRSDDDLQNIVRTINDTTHNLKIKLIMIEENDGGDQEIPSVNAPKGQITNYCRIPVISITNYYE